MVLGSRGPRSFKVRLTASLAVYAALVAPLQMAIAAPRGVAGAPSSQAGSSAHLATDSPWALSTRLYPAKIVALTGPIDAPSAGRLFDERAGTGLETGGQLARFRVELAAPVHLDAVAVFGSADGALTVDAESVAGPETLLDRASLARGGWGWNRREIGRASLARSFVVTWQPARSGALLRELELWGRPASAPPSAPGAPLDDLYTGLPPGARELRAAEGEATIGLATVAGPGVGGTFTVPIDVDPRSFERTFLVYELSGLPHFTSALRTINGQRALGRFGVSRGAKGGLQVEEISPEWLRAGDNRIQFLPAESVDPTSYRVGALRIVGIPKGETRLDDAGARAWSPLRDGRESTGWRAAPAKPAETRSWSFGKVTQPWALDLRLPGKGAGSLTVSAAGVRGAQARATVTVGLEDLSAGWHRIPLDKLPPTEQLAMSLAAGRELPATITEIQVEGSALPADEAPHLTVTYPLSGECVNHRIHVRGFLTPADATSVQVNGAQSPAALSPDGAFSFEMDEKAAGHNVTVEATYPGGRRVRRLVPIGVCVDRAPSVVVDGRRRQPVDDLGAPYGVTVKAGQAATLTFGGARLEIPAGAVEEDVRVTIRPLAERQVAPLESGMTNLSPGGQAFRFGPHGMVFKKPVRMALPYDEARLPTGFTPKDVRTFYYDENRRVWEQVGLVAQNDGQMVAVSEHFTDFINATVPMPEHPGTQSINPTSLKEMKVADPAAEITQIEPPTGDSNGGANLRFPIEAPPGRRGLQPDLAISYNSDAGNGWLGVGWTLEPHSIQVDTRFGAPKYQNGGDTYSLDGQLLTPFDPSNSQAHPDDAPPGPAYFKRRSEGRFDWIARVPAITDPGDFSWKVTDKNGVVYTYGADAGGRLASGGNTFRWYLQTVVDPFGNTMTYQYRTASGMTPDGDAAGLPWTQVYLSQITYTGGPVAPAYSIVFVSSEASHTPAYPQTSPPPLAGMRADVISSARGGFDVRTRELLDEIDVNLGVGSNAQTIRRYHLFYEVGDFQKTLLRSIGVYGAAPVGSDVTAGRFYEHAFTYFASDEHGFTSPVIWNPDPASSLDQGRGFADNETDEGGLNAFIGVGPDGCPSYVGGGGGFSLADDSVKTMFVDVNGDGLPDLLTSDGSVKLADFADSTRGAATYSSGPAVSVSTGCGLFHDTTQQQGAGLPLGLNSQTTATADIGGHFFGGLAGLSQTWSWSWGDQSSSLVDVDGDGLPDVVSTCNGFQVFPTIFDPSTGALEIGSSPSSNGSAGLASLDPAAIPAFNSDSNGPSQDQINTRLHPVSSLVSWTAPFAGHVVIGGTVQVTPTAVGTVKETLPPGVPDPEDGISAAIEHATTDSKTFIRTTTNLWTKPLAKTDPACLPDGTSACNGSAPVEKDVAQGDRLYFHVDPLNDIHDDTTTWDPTVTYKRLCPTCPDLTPSDLGQKDAYGQPLYIYDLTKDFRVIDPMTPGFFTHVGGVVTVTINAVSLGTPSPLNVRVLLNGHAVNASNAVTSIPAAAGTSQITTGPFTVDQGQEVVIEASYSNQTIDPATVVITPEVDYQNVCSSQAGQSSCPAVDTCQTDPTLGETCVIESTPPTTVPADKVHGLPEVRDSAQSGGTPPSTPITAADSYQISSQVVFKKQTDSSVSLFINSASQGPLFTGTLDTTAVPTSAPVAGPGDGLAVALTSGDAITAIAQFQSASDEFPDFPSPLALIWQLTLTDSSGNKTTIPVNFQLEASSPNESTRLLGGFRGWRYGEWNSDRSAPYQVLDTFDESVLFGSQDQDHAASLLRVAAETPRPSSTSPTPMIARETPEGRQQFAQAIWVGNGPDSFIGPGVMKPSRVGGVNPDRAGLAPNKLRKTFSQMNGPTGSVASFSLGSNTGETETRMEFMDLNGDRSPDSVTYGGAAFFDPLAGGFTSVGSGLNLAPAIPSGPSSSGALGTLQTSLVSTQQETISFGTAASAMVPNKDAHQTLTAVLSALPSFGLNSGSTTNATQFIDVNGDGLPDHVRLVNNAPMVQINLGYSFGPEIAWPLPTGAPSGCQALDCQQTGTNSLQIGFAGLGGGVAFSASVSEMEYIDVNGDGLPDRLTRAPDAPLSVELNLGTSFAAPETWDLPGGWPLGLVKSPDIGPFASNDALGFQETTTFNGGLGVYLPITVVFGCIALEISGQISQANGGEEMRFEDIDGDGKPDQILKLQNSPFRSGDTSKIYAKLNRTGKANLLQSVTRPLGGTIQIGYDREGNHVDHTLNPKVDMPRNQWVMTSAAVDDGRGNQYTNTFDYSALDQTGAPLSFGSGFYSRDEREDLGYAHVRTIRNAFDANGNVVPGHGDGSYVDSFYLNQDFYRKGLLQATFESDASGNLMRGTSVSYDDPNNPSDPTTDPAPSGVRVGTFFPRELQRETLFYEGTTALNALQALGAANGGAPKFKKEVRIYDSEGNLTSFDDWGDEQSTADDVHYALSYFTDAGTHIVKPSEIDAFPRVGTQTLLRKRLASYNAGVGTLKTLTNIVSGGMVPASTTVYNQASAVYSFGYDGFGNLMTFADPAGHSLKYTYDTQTQSHIARVDDQSFGYFSTATYDLRFGLIQTSVDVNGQKESYSYDTFGRLTQVFGPDDQGATVPTIGMTYNYAPSDLPASAVTAHKDVQHAGDPIQTVTFVDGLRRVIQTKKDIDVDAAGNGTVQTGMSVSGQVTFDNRGRVALQGQPIFDAVDPPALFAMVPMANATSYSYDTLGRPTKVIVPDGSSQGIETDTAYGIVTPGSTQNTLGDGGTWLLTSVTDADENLRLAYADARGNKIAVREFNTIGTSTSLSTLTTKYAYDPLDELLSVADAAGNVTSAAYDTIGQMVTVTSPDAGKTTYQFDLAGNLGSKQTAVLKTAGQFVKYAYTADRLNSITYPTSPQVTYTYGASTETGDSHGNVAGRIKQVSFDNGNETRTYDHMGNVNQTKTTLNRMSTSTGLPASMTFTMAYTYDWLGRMQNMTFPNWIDQSYNILAGAGELVTYVYDHGGNVDKITGFDQTPNPQQTSTPRNYTYLNHVGYNQFDQRTVLTSGNGILNQYGYDGPTRRLTSIKASANGSLEQQQKIGPVPFHNLQYTYDKVGNVTEMINNVSVQPLLNAGVFTGPLDVKYTYDDLYQLRSMSAKYRGNVAYGYQYSDTFTYDAIGNMLTKAQSQDRLVWNNQTVNTKDTNPVVTQLAGSTFDHNVTGLTFSLAYQYTSGRPHAAAPVTETLPNQSPAARAYTYDGNGNNTGNTFQQNHVVQSWNEENRLNEVDRNGGMLAKFRYNDQGERTKKQTSSGDAWYVNQYFVLLPGNLPTKHIFAGTDRVATKTDPIYMQTPVLDYYHNDHLGTTSYLTIQTQDLVQHERYFAFGGLWRPGDEQDETDLPRGTLERNWLFTGKEWDVDEGLYYFGSRYFDPHTDAWQSTDPILASYMRGKPNGGVERPGNLGLYTYALNNPVVLHDPTGQNWFKEGHGYKWHKEASLNGKPGYPYLIRFEETGSNASGATTGRLSLYGNSDKAPIATSQELAFSGGKTSDKGFKRPAPKGTYTINNQHRTESSDYTMLNLQDNGATKLKPFYGVQKVEPAYIATPEDSFTGAQGDWGGIRAYLKPDSGESGADFKGLYIHGKYNDLEVTHGCVCDKSERVLNALWNLSPTQVPIVPVEIK